MTIRPRTRSRWRPAAVVASVLALLLASCSPPADSDDGDKMSLSVGLVGSSGDTKNPYQKQGSPSSTALFKQVFDGLAERDNKGAVVLALAESIEPNETNDVWTIVLRDGVKLHNGEQLIAEDVAESLRWMIDPGNAFAFGTLLDFLSGPDDIEVVDDLTVKLNLKNPFGLVRERLAMDRITIRSVRNGATENEPNGTGPFVIDSFTPGREAKLSRFEDYWGDQPKISNLTFTYFTEQTAVTNAIRAGQIDVAQGVPFPEVPALEGDPNLELLISDTAAYSIVVMNTDESPFDQIKVRQALRLAVDRERIVSNAFGGYASVANDYIGKNTSCLAPDVPQRSQDIEAAKALVAEAGAQGTKVEIVTDAAFPGMSEMAQLIADDAAKIGLTISVRKLDVATFLERWLEWPFIVGHTSNPYEITAKAHFLPGGSENGSHFDDEEYTALAEELFQTTDAEAQCGLIRQMQTIEHERGGYIIPAFGQDIIVHRSNVSGLKQDLLGRSAFDVVDVTVK